MRTFQIPLQTDRYVLFTQQNLVGMEVSAPQSFQHLKRIFSSSITRSRAFHCFEAF